jgi:hypothetical protein
MLTQLFGQNVAKYYPTVSLGMRLAEHFRPEGCDVDCDPAVGARRIRDRLPERRGKIAVVAGGGSALRGRNVARIAALSRKPEIGPRRRSEPLACLGMGHADRG